MSPRDDLNEETDILPVREQNELLSHQYLVSTCQHNHPCNNIVNATVPYIRKRFSGSRFTRIFKVFYPMRWQLLSGQEKHQATSHPNRRRNNSIASYTPNPVLDTHPPKIESSEVQLRSGYCTFLTSIQLSCSTYRTRGMLCSLWKKPTDAAQFHRDFQQK